MKRFSPILSFAIMLMLFSSMCSACSMASCLGKGMEVRSNFIVKVRYAGKPLQGARVQVTSYGEGKDAEVVFSGITGSDGSAHVQLVPGEYWMDTGLFGVSAGYHCFHVRGRPSWKAKRQLHYDWGDFPSSTRVIAGVLLEFRLGDGETPLVKLVHGHEAPLNFVQVVLHDPTTLGSFETETDKDGHFSLEGIHDGTYVLDVLDSHLLVRVDRTSKKGALRLIDRPPFAGNCGGGVDIDPRS